MYRLLTAAEKRRIAAIVRPARQAPETNPLPESIVSEMPEYVPHDDTALVKLYYDAASANADHLKWAVRRLIYLEDTNELLMTKIK